MNKKDIRVLLRGCRNFSEIVLNLLYPPSCILCQNLCDTGICEKCKMAYPVTIDKRCMRCSKFIVEAESEYCQDCLRGKKYFIQGISLWKHSGKVKKSIYRFKYQNHRIYAKAYANILVHYYGDKIKEWAPEGLIGVPVHKSRLRDRGYNQAQVLAKAIASEIEDVYGVKLGEMTNCTYRSKNTNFQKVLDDRQRVENLQGVFGVKKGVELPEKLIIIDDIYTTGATINELAKVLKASGVKEVYFIAISIGQGF